MALYNNGYGVSVSFFFFQAEDGIRDYKVTGVQTCALPIWLRSVVKLWLVPASLRKSRSLGFCASPCTLNVNDLPSAARASLLFPRSARVEARLYHASGLSGVTVTSFSNAVSSFVPCWSWAYAFATASTAFTSACG